MPYLFVVFSTFKCNRKTMSILAIETKKLLSAIPLTVSPKGKNCDFQWKITCQGNLFFCC